MSDLFDRATSVFRDFNTVGDSLSGAYEPTKASARALLAVMTVWAEGWISDIVNAPTGDEAEGARYIVSASPNGLFGPYADHIAIKIDDQWQFSRPPEGAQGLFNLADQRLWQFTDGVWGHTSADSLGLGDAADHPASDFALSSRTITAGSGLSGGGALTSNVTLSADVRTVAGRTGAVTLTTSDIDGLGSSATHPASDFMQGANNLSDIANATTARATLSAAKSGANSDVTSLIGLTSPIPGSDAPVKSATTSAPPASPTDGDRYVVPSGSSGVWAAQTAKVAQWNAATSAWVYSAPGTGLEAYAQDLGIWIKYSGSAWTLSSRVLYVDTVAQLQSLVPSGITAPDGTTVFIDGDPYVYDSGITGTAIPSTPSTYQSYVVIDAAGRAWRELEQGRINLRRWGAKGDGSTDDTAAFSNAKAAAVKMAGGAVSVNLSAEIYIPPGNYVVTDSAALTYAQTPYSGGLTIRGAGMLNSQITLDFTNANGMSVTANGFFVLEDFGLISSAARRVTSVGHNLYIQRSSSNQLLSAVRRLYTSLAPQDGAFLGSCENLLLEGVDSPTNGRHGFTIDGTSAAGNCVTLKNCRAQTNVGRGVSLQNGTLNTFLHSSVFANNLTGGIGTFNEEVYLDSITQNATIQSCDIENGNVNSSVGITAGGKGHVILGGTVGGFHSGTGINLVGAKSCFIAVPRIYTSSSTMTAGIVGDSNSYDNTTLLSTDQFQNVTTPYSFANARNRVFNNGREVLLSYAPAYAATITPDFSSMGAVLKPGTLTGALAIADPSNAPAEPFEFDLLLLQDGTGGRAVTFSGSKWHPSAAIGSGTANQRWMGKFYWDGTDARQIGTSSWYT